ncbi:MAG: elongation factor G [Clostridia bacterium]|nr:elongation factor G [Clostridia bacterium]
MKQYDSHTLKNIALVGHGGSGKTSLAEAMLYLAGATDRLGKIADGNTVMDFDAEEKKRKASVAASVAPLKWQNVKINLIDTPGMFDFAEGITEGMRAADTALIVVSGRSGVTVGCEKAFKSARKYGKGIYFFVNKIDDENARFTDVIDALVENFGRIVCPIVVPVLNDRKIEGYINLLTAKKYTYTNGAITETEAEDMTPFQHWIDTLNEAIATTDEALMEKFFMGEPFTRQEQIEAISEAVKMGDLAPVFCGSATKMEGIDRLLDGIINYAPKASRGSKEVTSDGEELHCRNDEPLAAFVFKTVSDPFVGKLSYLKVVSGSLTPDTAVMNARTGDIEKISKLLIPRGGKQEEVDFICAGDIVAVAKLASLKTGDTVCSVAKKVELTGLDFPVPALEMAIKPKKKGEEEKIASALLKMQDEDPSIKFYNNTETKEMILRGMGELHIDVIVSKLKSKFSVEVELSQPRVAYRETIKKKVQIQGRHKKQSGGHGQFGDVWIEFEPFDGEFEFAERVVGGSVPKNFFPAVEKGLRDSIQKGVLAGYPMVGLKATLYDGSYHPVDSSEMSFKMAATIAYKAGIPEANPVILEPFGTLLCAVPAGIVGDIYSEVSKRRGRVMGANPLEDKYQEVVAEVPMAEMSDFATVLRQISQGRGSYSLEFVRYEEAPAGIAAKVIEDAKKRGEIE